MSQTPDDEVVVIPEDLQIGKPINQELLLKFLRRDLSNLSILVPPSMGGTGEDSESSAIKTLTNGNPIYPKSINFSWTNEDSDNVTSRIEESEAGCIRINTVEICGYEIWGDLHGNADTATILETSRTIALSGNAQGSVSFNGSQNVTIAVQSLIPVQSVSSAITVGTGHWGKILSCTSAVTITVPRIATNGFHVIIKNRSSGNVTISPSGCSIDGSSSSFTISKTMAIQLISDGTNYVAIDTSARLQ